MARSEPVALACTSSGSGPALVVLHGLFGSGTNWRAIARSLESRHTVHLVDARNHGTSPHAPSMRYEEMARDLVALLDRLGLDAVDLVGHSMGGKTAMMAALLEGARVRSLLVADVAPVAYAHDFDTELQAMRSLDLDRVSRRADADAHLARWLPQASLRAFLLQNLVQRDGRYVWRVHLESIAAAIADLTGFDAPPAAYTGPTLFLRGALSPYVRDAHRASIERLFPAARIQTLADAGHWLHAEQPRAFLAALDDHLARGG